ncbi:hypothetical protein [Nonomuraea salmonea]|uniref:NUDIX hydrolase n=1 Tax=Nonomuraea salmonea TaxID=46181 RepID=A0ABV5P2R0_9ACTN
MSARRVKRLAEPRCDHHMAAAIIHHQHQDRIAVSRRDDPVGEYILPGGHLDTSGVPKTVAMLTCRHLDVPVKKAELLSSEVRDDACSRPPGVGGTGHRWWVFAIETDINPWHRLPDAGHIPGTIATWWLSRIDVQAAAQRSADLATGVLALDEWEARPGFDPAYVRLLAAHGWASLTGGELEAIEQLARAGLSA